MLSRTVAAGTFEVVQQQGTIVRMSAVFNNCARPLLGGQAAQVCQALFRDDYGDVMLGVVHVTYHWHDA